MEKEMVAHFEILAPCKVDGRNWIDSVCRLIKLVLFNFSFLVPMHRPLLCRRSKWATVSMTFWFSLWLKVKRVGMSPSASIVDVMVSRIFQMRSNSFDVRASTLTL